MKIKLLKKPIQYHTIIITSRDKQTNQLINAMLFLVFATAFFFICFLIHQSRTEKNLDTASKPHQPRATYSEMARFSRCFPEFEGFKISMEQFDLYWNCFNSTPVANSVAKLDAYCVALACYSNNPAFLHSLLQNYPGRDYDTMIEFLSLERQFGGRILDSKDAIRSLAVAFDSLCRKGILSQNRPDVKNFTERLSVILARLDDAHTPVPTVSAHRGSCSRFCPCKNSRPTNSPMNPLEQMWFNGRPV